MGFLEKYSLTEIWVKLFLKDSLEELPKLLGSFPDEQNISHSPAQDGFFDDELHKVENIVLSIQWFLNWGNLPSEGKLPFLGG